MTTRLPGKIVVWLPVILYAYLFLAGLIGYEGSKVIYLAFSVTFAALLLSALYKPSGYSYMFLAIFMWLGFWFKFTANFFILGYLPFEEPVGLFDETSAASWDHGLSVAMVASVAIMLARVAYLMLRLTPTITAASATAPPAWYPRNRLALWSLLVCGMVGIGVLNATLGIQQAGLVPRTILHWPFNALIYWLLSTGFSMMVATFLWWDAGLKKHLLTPVLLACVEALVSSAALLSRGAAIFHALPVFFATLANWRIAALSLRQGVVVVSLFLALFVASIVGVSHMRDFQYNTPSAVKAVTSVAPAADGNAAPKGAPTAVSSVRLKLLHQLIINRWIGLEGVLAVSAYPAKSPALFFTELKATSQIGVVDTYQKISNSSYQDLDSSRFQFSSLPGATAFLYYSGSIWYVFAGMWLLAFVSMCGERLALLLTGNVFLCAIFGVNFANAIAQLGIAPRQLIPHLGMLVAGIFLIGAVQSALVEKILLRGKKAR